MLQIFKKQTKKQKYLRKEYSAANYVPYYCHWNSTTILTHDFELIRVIKLGGFSFETADDDEVDAKKSLRNGLFKGIAMGTVGLYFHTIRRTQKAFPDGEFPNFFSHFTNEQWRFRHGGKSSFVNEHYITIIRKKRGFICNW